MSSTERVAVVTGGGAGIGRAAARALAERGAAVLVADADGAGAEETARIVREAGGRATAVTADVSDASQVGAMVARAVSEYGRLDWAYNNAGIEGPSGPLDETADEDWQRVIAVNLTGVWLCMRAEIPAIEASGGGAIVNCSSVAGLVGFPAAAAYVASKHGVVGLTRTAALDLAERGIRVNAVCPGIVHTAMIDRYTHGDPALEAALTSGEPVGRMGTPEEVAAAVAWLLADAPFVTGTAIPVDGGWTAR